MKWETLYIMDWITRMSKKYGHTVQAVGKKIPICDWGQALCVEVYGENTKEWPDEPSTENVIEAAKWESDGPPKWIINDVRTRHP